MEGNGINKDIFSQNHEPLQVDAEALHYQNQKLHQQIEKQKQELHDLEEKIKKSQEKQGSYDDMLIAVNQLWNQLVDDLILLGACIGGDQNALQTLDCVDISRGSIPSCPVEEMFLCRLLQKDSIEANDNDGIIKYIEEALSFRHASTRALLTRVEGSVNAQMAKTESLYQALGGVLFPKDAISLLSKIDDMMKEEANNLRSVIDALHSKHKVYIEQIATYKSNQSTDQSEIKRLAGELDDTMAELEESRRKLINLKMQKDAASGIPILPSGAVNGHLSPEKSAERTITQDENLTLSKQVEALQSELKDDKYIHSSRLYTLLNDQLQHWNAEVERYRAMIDALQFQVGRSLVIRRDKELNAKVESADAARNAVEIADSRTEELELQLQKSINEKNDLEVKMEETIQDLGRKDIKAEFHVMASALSREMKMMEVQLKRWQETADETLSLREKAQSLKLLLSKKTIEQKSLAEKCAEQVIEVKDLKEMIEELQKEQQEVQLFLDMYGQESNDNRLCKLNFSNLMEIKESERRAHAQAEVLKNALDEHSLELRVKAANEAAAACQLRLSAAEAELTDLRAKLDSSERDILELEEAIKIKDAEADAYISEIETIGQAYEDMQTQHQHLLEQVAERDDYNIKLVSESVKTRQAHSLLHSEKQALTKQLQQMNTLIESLRTRIVQGEEQVKVLLSEAIKVTEEERHIKVNLETAKWELADAEKEAKCSKLTLSSSEKEYEQLLREIDSVQSELDNER
ncbi:hypothetical protein G4B88_030286 [Cannabis sativa]|uniref:E3 ubiquitin protein ligase n=1 Tax=Cannabis sativa TaxID=3483 RepID=A0A7J6EF30_CANSA|nr:hypothetical protein G4B88_030286 [Cannabis sativa]